MEKSTSTGKKSWAWRILRWGLILIAGLITLVALVWVEENVRGKRAWLHYKREQEAKGEKFELKDFIPPPVPDAENFAKTPFLAPLSDYNPKPLKKDQFPWRDTNGFFRVQDFGSHVGWQKSASHWPNAHRIDLTAWTTALDGKKDVPASGESPVQRATSATVILEKMKRYDDVLKEFRTASHRPYCRFDFSFVDGNPQIALFPEFGVLKSSGMILHVRATAKLAAGNPGGALEDIELAFYLADTIRNEPTLMAAMVRNGMIHVGMQPVWEGLADRSWNEAQLKELQERLQKIDLLEDYVATMRGERAFNIAILEYERKTGRVQQVSDSGVEGESTRINMPSGWMYQNALAISRMYERLVFPAVDADKHRMYLNLITNSEQKLNRELQGGFYMYTIFAKLMFPAILGSAKGFAHAQVVVDEAVLACALERYRLAHGQFPETLDALSPQFIEKLPPDVITGEPLKYRRTDDGQFILYSVGWNGKDDGGTVVMSKEYPDRVNTREGDWVWRYPEKLKN